MKIVFFSLLSENVVRGQGQSSSLKVIGQGHQDHNLKNRSEFKVNITIGKKVTGQV